MPGAIIGDTAAGAYERRKYTGGDWDAPLFPQGSRFTDDTILTIACYDAMKDIRRGIVPRDAFRDRFQKYAKAYPDAGYGRQFRLWIDNPVPYGSFGNGAAMRVSPIGWLCEDEAQVMELAAASAAVSHDHPEGIKATQAAAMGVFLARKGASKDEIKAKITEITGYDLDRKLADIRPAYKWSSHSQKSVPEAIICFLEGDGFESAIRSAIWLGGDADTQAAIAGSIAEAFYGGAPEWMLKKARGLLDRRLNAKVDEWIEEVKQPDGKEGHRLALKAEKEWLETGKVSLRCPKCGEHPEVDSNSHGAFVKCPCGYVRMGELREI